LLERELIEFMVTNLAVNPNEGAGQLTLMNNCYLELFQSHRSQLRPELSPMAVHDRVQRPA
jgi:hypothetical protein